MPCTRPDIALKSTLSRRAPKMIERAPFYVDPALTGCGISSHRIGRVPAKELRAMTATAGRPFVIHIQNQSLAWRLSLTTQCAEHSLAPGLNGTNIEKETQVLAKRRFDMKQRKVMREGRERARISLQRLRWEIGDAARSGGRTTG